jgi:hypothetical protein
MHSCRRVDTRHNQAVYALLTAENSRFMCRFKPNMRINRLLAAAAVPLTIGIALLPATLVG